MLQATRSTSLRLLFRDMAENPVKRDFAVAAWRNAYCQILLEQANTTLTQADFRYYKAAVFLTSLQNTDSGGVDDEAITHGLKTVELPFGE